MLVDRFLDDAIEIDVDALCDGTELYLGGVMEHIEEAGIHSGDSSCALPPITLGATRHRPVRRSTEAIARGIGVRGLINVQYALKDDVLYVLEANPRASRTVPFVSKATAVPLAKAAARIMLGETIAELRAEGMLPADGDGGELPADAPIAVKEAVLPFNRFRTPDGKGVDSLLGPEMKSTGEVMGIDADFGTAFAKSQAAAYGSLPTTGKVFVSVANRDKRDMIFPVKRLADLGFEILATAGTARGAAPQRHRRRGRAQALRGHRRRGEPTTSQLITAASSTWSSTRPHGSPRRSPRSTATRSAPPRSARTSRASPPCRGWRAAVKGIEAIARRDRRALAAGVGGPVTFYRLPSTTWRPAPTRSGRTTWASARSGCAAAAARPRRLARQRRRTYRSGLSG